MKTRIEILIELSALNGGYQYYSVVEDGHEAEAARGGDRWFVVRRHGHFIQSQDNRDNPVNTGKIIIIVTISNECTLDNANCIHHAAVQHSHNINDSTNYRHNSQCQCTIRLYYSA